MHKFWKTYGLVLLSMVLSASLVAQENDSTLIVAPDTLTLAAPDTIAALDTVPLAAKPIIDYTLSPQEYTIADIRVSGAETYEDFVIIGFSGLTKGQKIKIPGTDITSAIKRFWKQGYFSDVKIMADKIEGDRIWLEIALKQRPRISRVSYYGLKKSEEEDITPKVGLTRGSQVTPDLLDRAKIAIQKAMAAKGYHNAAVVIYQKPDATQPGSVALDINVDKKSKVRVHTKSMSKAIRRCRSTR